MATLNFSINVPDAELTRVAKAVKGYFGNPAMTNAQAIEALRQEFIARLKEIVVAHDRKTAVEAAEAANYDVDAT